MTTSGSYSFTVSRDQIIRQAMLNIRKLDGIENPSDQEINDCNFVLNMLVKQWMGQTDFAPGLKAWKQQLGYLFLSSSENVYSLGPNGVGWTFAPYFTTAEVAAAKGASSINVADPSGLFTGQDIGILIGSNPGDIQWLTVGTVVGHVVNLVGGTLSAAAQYGTFIVAYDVAGGGQATQPLSITTANLRDSQGSDTPLRIFNVQDYDALPGKVMSTNISDPTAIYYEFHLDNSNLYIDIAGAQDPTKYLVLRYQEAVQDMVNPNDTFDYPQEWYLTLAWGLSKQIAPMFKARWTAELEDMYKSALLIAGQKDPETSSMYFQCGADS